MTESTAVYLIAGVYVLVALVAVVWVVVRDSRATDPPLSVAVEQALDEYGDRLDQLDEQVRHLPYLTTALPLPADEAMAARIQEARTFAAIAVDLADIDRTGDELVPLYLTEESR